MKKSEKDEKSVAKLTQSSEVKTQPEDGKAPVIEFDPYASEKEYRGSSLSATLMAKSTELSRTIWRDKETYHLAQGIFPAAEEGSAEAKARDQNNEFWPGWEISSEITRMFSTATQTANQVQSTFRYQAETKVLEVLEKLKKLERTETIEDLFHENVRVQITDALLPVSGAETLSFNSGGLNLRWPTRPVVALGQLEESDIDLITRLLMYVPDIREIISVPTWRVYTDRDVTKEDLLKPLIPTNTWRNREFDKNFIKRLHQLQNFFHRAVPAQIARDHITSMYSKVPAQYARDLQSLHRASTKLRNTLMKFIREEETLSELLQRIINLAHALSSYYGSIVNEIGGYFQYLNKIGMTFEQLVSESNHSRLAEEEAPW